VLEAARAPGRRIPFDGQQILAAPGKAVQDAAILSGGDLFVGLFRMSQAAFLGQVDDEVHLRVVLLQPREIHLGQVDR
jgi:hypothetical protein